MFENEVASIMVTYNPEADVVENAQAILKTCFHLVIIDNGSGNNSKSFLKALENEQKVTLIYNNSNLGLGHALNHGVRYILGHENLSHINWIATFDQDSKVESTFFTQILKAYERFDKKDEVGILAPNWIEEKLNKNAEVENKSSEIEEQLTVITSGSLIKRSIFQETGLFKEEYFIDFLDHEFCLRVRSFGFRVFMVPDVSMIHNLGNTQSHKIFGSNVFATNHNYIRRYYITRNRLYTYKKFFRTEKDWIKADLTSASKEIIILFLFEKNRLKKLQSIILGVFDALRGKKGNKKFN